MQPFRDKARDYLSGTEKPPVPLKREALQRIALHPPRKLVKHVVKDFNENDAKGGGIGSALGAIGQVTSNLLGVQPLMENVFGVQKPKPLTLDQEFAAYLVEQSYKDIDERPDTVLKRFERLAAYDTDHVSVWRNTKTDELTVAVRGTELSWSDILSDINLLLGSTNVASKELDKVLDQLESDYPQQKYDIAAHSLGTAFVENERQEHSRNWDEVFMFNPASSPAQNDQFEKLYANNEQYSYFVNHGDLVSANLIQFMTPETLQNNVQFGSYVWSPVGAHSLTNWYPEGFAMQDGTATQTPDKPPSGDTAELQQDTPETQAAGLS